MCGRAVTVFLPSRKFLFGMFTHRWTVMFFSPWMTAAVLRIKSSGVPEVTMSIYNALHYAQLINYILRNSYETIQRRRLFRSATVMDEKESRLGNTSMT